MSEPAPLCDVVAVSFRGAQVFRIMLGGISRSRAEACVRMAEMRHGTRDSFYAIVAAGSYREGDVYKPGQ